MLRLKSCPRCKGDMHQNRDMYGHYDECLQCGYMKDIEAPDKPASPLTASEGKRVA